MMVWAQIGDSPDVGILILLVRFFVNIFIFFGDVIDARLVLLAVGVDHQSSVAVA